MSTTSCSSFSPYKVPIIQGNIWEEDDIEKIKVGLTKDQVEFIFGTAVIKDPFRDYRWDYFNSVQIGEKMMQENNELRDLLAVKYDRETLEEVLQLDRVDLEEILRNCNFSEGFIKSANDLQILEAISGCYEEYKVLSRR